MSHPWMKQGRERPLYELYPRGVAVAMKVEVLGTVRVLLEHHTITLHAACGQQAAVAAGQVAAAGATLARDRLLPVGNTEMRAAGMLQGMQPWHHMGRALHPVPAPDAAAKNAVLFCFLVVVETQALLRHLQLLSPHSKDDAWLSLHAAATESQVVEISLTLWPLPTADRQRVRMLPDNSHVVGRYLPKLSPCKGAGGRTCSTDLTHCSAQTRRRGREIPRPPFRNLRCEPNTTNGRATVGRKPITQRTLATIAKTQ